MGKKGTYMILMHILGGALAVLVSIFGFALGIYLDTVAQEKWQKAKSKKQSRGFSPSARFFYLYF